MTLAGNTRTSQHSRGFTIIEMLAVLFILAIIVALVASVSVYVLNEANKKDTRSTMAIINEAILAYEAEKDDKPREIGGYGTTYLFTDLKGCPEAFKKIEDLPASAFQGQSTRSYFTDAWGTQLRYYKDAGRGSAALLVSAGPDSVFDTDDDIRSDQP